MTNESQQLNDRFQFRAQSGPKGEWEYFSLPDDAGYLAGRFSQKRIKNLTQSTSLRDCKGTLIFEGDVVRCKQSGQSKVGKVVFAQGMFGWDYGEKQASWLYKAVKNWNGEVIGNVFENPEFLQSGCQKGK